MTRYAAQRITTRAWLHQDLRLTEVEQTWTLSGPGGLSATLRPELLSMVAADGLPVLEKYATMVYALDDVTGDVMNGGLITDQSFDLDGQVLTIPGPSAYPHGYIYDDQRLWGPNEDDGTVKNPARPRPDPVQIFQDLWTWLQARQDSNLLLGFTGNLHSSTTIGDYETPYRLDWQDLPDIGDKIDELTAAAPFDWKEEWVWNAAKTDIYPRIHIGFPRLGKRQNDLRFADGENIVATTTADSANGDYANYIIGIGKGSGASMKRGDAMYRDGHLRRIGVVTDKTVDSDAACRTMAGTILSDRTAGLDITSVTVRDTRAVRLSQIVVGDEIRVQTFIESYGDIDMWLRVVSISVGDDPSMAVLSTKRASTFNYSATTEVT